MRLLRRRRFENPEEIHAAQERSVEAVEVRIAAGDEKILVGGRWIHREAAWAACRSLRLTWETPDARYDGQERAEDGTWIARLEMPGGTVRLYVLGRFPG